MKETNGACVISLDFELMWGVREMVDRGSRYVENLLGARRVVPRLLDLFEQFEISATWATVGLLFANDRSEIEELAPLLQQPHPDRGWRHYMQRVGRNEQDDPLHFGGTLVRRISMTPRQEIATHTFSHIFGGEEGTSSDDFRADLLAALEIASRRGIRLESIVFPRNQHNPDFDPMLRELGIHAYRGNPATYSWRFSNTSESRRLPKRALRFVDSYFGYRENTIPWSAIPEPSGLANVRASLPLRPHVQGLKKLQSLQFQRIRNGLRRAAHEREIFHLWWHPHTIGARIEENLAFLREVLTEVARLRQEAGLQSLTMVEVARRVREEPVPPHPCSVPDSQRTLGA